MLGRWRNRPVVSIQNALARAKENLGGVDLTPSPRPDAQSPIVLVSMSFRPTPMDARGCSISTDTTG